MNPIINIGTQAIREAAKLLVRSMEHLESVELKTEDRAHFTRELKRMATEEITAVIHKAHPTHAVTTTPDNTLGSQGTACWIIDAINGEANFMHSLPHFAISIAIKLQNKITAALIYDFLRDELFVASYGQGARLNDRRLRVSQTKKLSAALIGSNNNHNLSEQFAGIRISGCPALDLAYLAAARLDGYFNNHITELDSAAGLLLVTEAGGLVQQQKTQIYAANPKIHKELLTFTK